MTKKEMKRKKKKKKKKETSMRKRKERKKRKCVLPLLCQCCTCPANRFFCSDLHKLLPPFRPGNVAFSPCWVIFIFVSECHSWAGACSLPLRSLSSTDWSNMWSCTQR